MSISSLLLPTNKLYQAPSYEAYDTAKNEWIKNRFGSDFDTKSVENRWDLLVKRFEAEVDVASRPLFVKFREEREKVEKGNRHNLQLDQSLIYFENFYFLYCNDDKEQKLSLEAKTKLFNQIKEGMSPNVCEPGKTTHFETALQEARKDTNYIFSELHKQRRLIIQRIADEYNTKNEVSRGMSIHTIMWMQKLAKSRKLGIKPENEIEDAYLFSLDTGSMTDYFNRVSPEKFSEYQRTIAANLTAHVMLEIADWLRNNGLKTRDWETGCLRLSDKQQAEFSPFMEQLLGVTLSEFGDFDDNDYKIFILHKKEIFLKMIPKLMPDKLIQDGFFVKFADLDHTKLSSYDVCLPQGINLEELVNFADALGKIDAQPNSFEHSRDIFLRHEKLIRQYPILLADIIAKNHNYWFCLPRSTKNDIHIVDACVTELTNLLLKTEDETEINKLLDGLFVITKSYADYNFATQLMARKNIVLKLVSKNGLLLRHACAELQKDEEVINAAIVQNPLAYYFSADSISKNIENTLRKKHTELYSRMPHTLTFSTHGDVDEMRANLIKMQNIVDLCTTNHISTGKLAKLVQSLTPSEFLTIIDTRASNNLRELPYCNKDNLNQFYDSAGKHFWDTTGYLGVKRSINTSIDTPISALYLSKEFHQDLAKKTIAESSNWFLAFIAYQNQLPTYHTAFNSFSDVMAQLKLSAWSLLNLLISLGEFLLKSGKNVLIAYLLYQASPFLFESFSNAITAAIQYLIGHVGLLPIAFIQAALLTYLVKEIFSIEDPTTILLISIGFFLLQLVPTYLLLSSTVLAIAAVVKYLGPLLLQLASSITGHNLSWSEAKDVMLAAFSLLLLAEENLYLTVATVFLEFAGKFLWVWPDLIFATFIPWITRTWASTVSPEAGKTTAEQGLITDVENSIVRLTTSDEPSAIQKGDLLEELWDKVQDDAAHPDNKMTLSQGLNKQYTVSLAAQETQKTLSFWEVAATPRDSSNFNVKSAPTSNYPFFGLSGKTTTARQDRKSVV